MHATIASQYAPGGDLPCADGALLDPVEASVEFAAIRHRLAHGQVLDSWQEDGLHFFVFPLRPADVPGDESLAVTEAPLAVFAMHREASEPVSAVVVTPLPGGREAEIRDLRTPDAAYVAPVSA